MFSMNVAASLPVGLPTRHPWPLSGAPVDYRPTRSDEVVRRVAGPLPVPAGRSHRSLNAVVDSYWAIDPFAGCEFACTYCQARELPPFRDAEFRRFERNILVRVNARDAVAALMRDEENRGAPLLLGHSTDPWQPTEKNVNVTRGVLQELARYDGVDLRAQTRSNVVARDAILLGQIARRGSASVSFSIGTLDYRLSRQLEPLAPSPDRRFIAMEVLARAGVTVGLVASPILPGLNDTKSALNNLARRARNCGATYALASPLVMPMAARERVVRHVACHDADLADRYDRLLARTADDVRGFRQKLRDRFREACDRVGLQVWEPEVEHRPAAVSAPPRRRLTPNALQLELW